ncbi:MAG: Fe-S protein assembly co-chaperone HscB [Magnetococcales bacterium]|nr:Fe-S protein assembly co-chaperone HscB [Magnetococcales bacterium]
MPDHPQQNACWSCKGPAGEGLFCAACQALQPPNLQQNYFQMLDHPPTFKVDRTRLETSYQALQQQLHPDRFATRTARERRFSMEHVTRLNEGYATLREPLARAGYLLQLHGRASGDEASGAAPTDPMFLMETMELREALEAIDPAQPDADEKIDAMRQDMERRVEEEEQGMANAFEAHNNTQETTHLEKVAQHMDRLRYHNRFLEEVERLEEKLFV